MRTRTALTKALLLFSISGIMAVFSSCEREEAGRLKALVRIDSVFDGSPGGFSVKVHVEDGRGDDGKIIARGVTFHNFLMPDLNNGTVTQDLSGSSDFVAKIVTQTSGAVRAYIILKDGTILYSDKVAGERKDYFSYTNISGEKVMIVREKVNNINMTGVYMNSPILVGASSNTDGEGNTAKIVANTFSSAANFCDDLYLDGYEDWYLPAVSEYVEAGETLGWFNDNDIGANFHWTSTESSASVAMGVSGFGGNANVQQLNKQAFTFFTCMRRD